MSGNIKGSPANGAKHNFGSRQLVILNEVKDLMDAAYTCQKMRFFAIAQNDSAVFGMIVYYGRDKSRPYGKH